MTILTRRLAGFKRRRITGADERSGVRHVFAVFLLYLVFILAGIGYFLVIGLRHL